MSKHWKIYLAIFLSSFAVVGLFMLLAGQRLDFFFANEGKLICTTQKDWGFISQGTTRCYMISPVVGQEQKKTATPSQNPVNNNGEIQIAK